MIRLPILHPATLCRSGGDTCGDYVDDGRGGCRYFSLTNWCDADGPFAVPTCALAQADGGAQSDGEVGAVLGVTGNRARQLARRAETNLRRRAKVARLRDLLDHDAFAASRKPVEVDPEEEGNGRRPHAVVRVVLGLLASGPMTATAIGNLTGTGHVSRTLRRLEERGLVVRTEDAWTLAPVQFDKEAS